MFDEFTFFDRLPAEIKDIVGKQFNPALVPLKDIAALAQTSKVNYQLFQDGSVDELQNKNGYFSIKN